MITVRDLVDRVNRLAARVEDLPQFRWGRVETTSPVSVVLDTETEPITGVSTIANLELGARVLVLKWKRRATVLGVANPPGPAANRIRVDGRDYQASGLLAVAPGPWNAASLTVSRRVVDVPMPITPPTGYSFQTWIQSAPRASVASTVGVNWSASTIRVAIVQFGSVDQARVVLGWRLTRI